MNLVTLLGRVTKDYDLRTVGDKGTENCSFTLAVDREFKNKDGEREADFLNIVCWGATAKFAHRFFQKGSRMLLTGSIQSRSYDNAEGKKVYITEIVAKTIEFVDTKKDTESRNISAGVPASGDKEKQYLPPEVDEPDFGLPFDL